MPQSHTSQLYNCGGGQDGTTQHAGAHGQVRGDLEQGEQVRDHGAGGGKLVIHTYTGLSHIRECSHNTRRCRVSDTGVILSKEVATVRCEVILTNMCSSVLMEHGGQARSSIILSMTVYGQLKGISN